MLPEASSFLQDRTGASPQLRHSCTSCTPAEDKAPARWRSEPGVQAWLLLSSGARPSLFWPSLLLPALQTHSHETAQWRRGCLWIERGVRGKGWLPRRQFIQDLRRKGMSRILGCGGIDTASLTRSSLLYFGGSHP